MDGADASRRGSQPGVDAVHAWPLLPQDVSSPAAFTVADALRAFLKNVSQETVHLEYNYNEQGSDCVTAKYSAETYFVHEVHHASVSSNGVLLLRKTVEFPWSPICEHHAEPAASARPYQPRLAKDRARRRRR